MDIREITNELEKTDISRHILEALPEWFSIPESREEYIRGSQGKKFFCAFIEENPVGFLCLKQTGKDFAVSAGAIVAVKSILGNIFPQFAITDI